MGSVLSGMGRFGAPQRKSDVELAELPPLKKLIANPGILDDLHNKVHEIQPKEFSGLFLMWDRRFSEHLTVSHTMRMHSKKTSGYLFGADYVGHQRVGLNELYPWLYGEMDAAGNLSAHLAFQPTDHVQFTFASLVHNPCLRNTSVAVHFRAPSSTASLIVRSPTAVNLSTFFETSYLKAVSPHLVLGVELIYKSGKCDASSPKIMINAVGHYVCGDAILAGTVGANEAHVSCYHHFNEYLQIGVELDASHRIPKSVGKFAAQLQLPKNAVSLRGSFDTNYNIVAVFEKRLQPMPIAVALSAHLVNGKEMRLGCSLHAF